ncbi:bacteriophage protein, PF04883 family [Acinetobacter sp. WC-743]|uniref:HK97-gp10 family putative phage morphogenesis protein n=1 Tax=Acinetobacter sp. WC-743 TaxID=903945 RepID=UPI0002AEC023|nr:HK97-gp10 family putative phage morphogenesis protein [Acinetobacter sp. WC-743]ELW82084.1 bacteriophage protein, PF04883 family [Acinetobacter sp. WC-743]
MIDVSVRVDGLDDLTQQLQQLESLGKQKQLTQNALFYASKPMLDEVKALAPKAEKAYYRYWKGRKSDDYAGKERKLVKPGKLKKSIKRRRVKIEGSAAIGIYVGGTKWLNDPNYYAFYWRFLEYGTPNLPATPFIRPSFDKHKEQAVERFKERYREYVNKITQRKNLEAGVSNAS